MGLRLASEEDNVPHSAEFYRDSGAEVIVAEEDGSIQGSAVYLEKEDYGVIQHIEVYNHSRGQGIGSVLLDEILDRTDTDEIYAQDTTMDGKVQEMLQNRGFEISGIGTRNEVTDVQENPSGGLNLHLWNLDEDIQAYIPEELREFTERTAQNQRNIDYLEPDQDQLTGSFDVIRSSPEGKTVSEKNNKLEVRVGEGSTLQKHIEGAIDCIDTGDYWAKTVSLDTTEPVSYNIARNLHEEGYQPIGLSPRREGQELTMLDLETEAGIYNVTEDTLRFIESTGLDYEIVGSDNGTQQIVFLPDS